MNGENTMGHDAIKPKPIVATLIAGTVGREDYEPDEDSAVRTLDTDGAAVLAANLSTADNVREAIKRWDAVKT